MSGIGVTNKALISRIQMNTYKSIRKRETTIFFFKWTKFGRTNKDIQMVRKHMKRYSASLIIRAVQVKTARAGQKQNKNLTTPSVDEDVELKCSDIAGISGNWHNYFGKLFGRICYI